MPIATINPATGETLEEFTPHDHATIDAAIGRAHATAGALRRTGFAERATWMQSVAGLLDAEREDIARTLTIEMGKTFAAARAEVAKCATACRFYAERAEGFLAPAPVEPDAVGARQAWTRYQPLGPVLAVMPWNFPLWQVIRFAAPALMAGNTGLLKHASNVPRTALYLGDLFVRGGFPDGAFQTLLVGSDAVEGVLRDGRVRAATLTGSAAAGRSVAAIAGDELKPTVLELGGSDPFVVTAAADLDEAARVAVVSRVQNNGQSCIAAKRFIVLDEVADEFEDRVVERMAALRVGDPMDEATDVGPLATRQGRQDATELVADALGKGAELLFGGEPIDGPGWFHPPTLLAGVTPDMRLYHEEVFAPVAPIYRVPDLDAAIDLANATAFGLGSNIWTDDPDERDRFVSEVDAGAVFVNGMTTSYPDLPFGGVKSSGYGRELAAEGIRAFCNAKTVWVGDGAGDGEAGTARAE